MKKMGKEKENVKQTNSSTTLAHVMKYTGVFGGVQGLKIFLSLLRNKLTANFLGTVGMGLNAIYVNIAEIINSSTNLGIPFSAVRNLSELSEEKSQDEVVRFIKVIRTWCLWTAILAAVLCVALSPVLSYSFFNGSYDYSLSIVFLSLMVFSLPIEAGECAILKGMKRLKTVATVETLSTVSVLLTTVPFYYLWGINGIVISLTVTHIVVAIIHLWYSTRFFPYSVELLSRSILKDGMGMVKIGIPYVLASIAGAVTTALIFGYLEDQGQIGLYKAGYSLMVMYGGLVFVAMEADYFPRLSAINHDTERMNQTINQQIDVCLLLITPLLIVFALALPVIVPLLYTDDFLPILPMCTVSCIYMFLRGVVVPLEYTALAKGESIMYLIIEVIYDIVCIFLVSECYNHFGLLGAGIGLIFTITINLLLVVFVYWWRYGCRVSLPTLKLFLFQFACLLLVVIVCFLDNLAFRYVIGIAVFLLSSIRSLSKIGDESSVVRRIKSKISDTSPNCDCCK